MSSDQSLRRVIWFEGMNLDPRHFQQMDRFHQAALDFRISSLTSHDWGLLELKINEEAIANGQFSLVSCKGVMPDGLIVNMPDSDRLPPSRALSDLFPATAEKLDIFLAIRSERPLGGNIQLDPKSSTADSRFEWDGSMEVSDENEGGRVLPIGTAHANFRIKLGGEPLDDFISVKIAEVRRKVGSGFMLSDTFVPTILYLIASENLMSMLRDLLSELARRSTGQKGQFSFGKAEFNSAETASFWLAQTLNRHIPVLNYHYHLGKCHPEQLYLAMAALAGELTTYPTQLAKSASELPLYKHEDLQCLVFLKETIRELLASIQPITPYMEIILESVNEAQWQSNMLEPSQLRPARIYLCIKSKIPEEKLKADIPKLAKVASPASITQLITYNLPGLSLGYVAHPPVGLPTGAGEQYFRVEKAGDIWDSVIKENCLSLFIPKDLELLNLKVLVLKD